MKRIVSCVAVLIAVATLLSACGAGSDHGGRYETTADSAAAYDYDYGDYYEEYDSYAAEDSDNFDYKYGQGAAQELPLLTPDNDKGTKLVYTVEMQLETVGFEGGTRNLVDSVTDVGGYIVRTTVHGRSLRYPEIERSAVYTVKIPSEHLASFLAKMEDDYNLLRLDQDSEDITTQYTRTDSRLELLREQEEMLRQAIEGEEDEEERLALERERLEVQNEIDRHSATVERMDSDILYSTVTLHLYEVILDEDGAELDPFGTRLSTTASGSWDSFLLICQNILLTVIVVLPALVILAVIGLITLAIIRIVKHRDRILAKFRGNKKEDDDSVQ